MIVLLETVHADAQRVLQEVDDVVLVAETPVFDDALPLDEISAIVTRGRGQVTERLLARLSNLRAVVRCGAGLDNIDTAAAHRAGVTVLHAPGSTTVSVAEHAVMLMLALARRLVKLDNSVKQGSWSVRDGYEGVEMRGKRLGIVGLGAIGGRIARIAEAFDMDVVASTRRPIDGRIPLVDFDELVATSDVIQLCVPLTGESTGLFGARTFATMRPGSLLVNTARGPIVDHHALADALGDGRCGGYAADVWDPEPPSVDGLASDPRVLITPHVAGLTDVTYREICVRPCTALATLLRNQPPDPTCIFDLSAQNRR